MLGSYTPVGRASRALVIGFDLLLLVAILYYAFAPSEPTRRPHMQSRSLPAAHRHLAGSSEAHERRENLQQHAHGAEEGKQQQQRKRRRQRQQRKQQEEEQQEQQEEEQQEQLVEEEAQKPPPQRRHGGGSGGRSGREARRKERAAKRRARKEKEKEKKRAAEEAEEGEKNASAAEPLASSCTTPPPATPCTSARHALVTLSTGKRSHFAVTRVPMKAYAERVGAEFVVVDSLAHPSLAGWNSSARSESSSHFIKLPMLRWFLRHYGRVLFVDDDVLISPFAPDLFAQVACHKVGAVIEAYHPPAWHAMHTRSLCDIYRLRDALPAVCDAKTVKKQRVFNSGVMVLSEQHGVLLDDWASEKLECRILCDQLYLNAMVHKHKVCVHDLGTAFNLPGTQVRKMLATTSKQRAASPEPLDLRDSPVAQSCIIHLTVLPAKQYTSDYLLRRAISGGDVMQCSGATADTAARAAAIAPLLPQLTYDIEKIWCHGWQPGCQLVPPPARGPGSAAADGTAAARLPVGSTKGGGGGSASAELPEAALAVVRRAAALAWDGRTVILLFATADFTDLLFNWAQAARRIGVLNFVLVAMDKKLGEVLARFESPPGLLLPRVASGNVTIIKRNVIGERQRFGLRVLEAGFNVLFADLDAIFLKTPAPLLTDGDIIGERIWGRPPSLVDKWGAAICTGFYFMRSTPQTVSLFRKTHFLIANKRKKQPRWQASDQWAINHAIDDAVVEWASSKKMAPISDYNSKYHDTAPHVGRTTLIDAKFVVLPHVLVARSCPILKFGASQPPADDKVEQKKWQLWQHLLRTAYVLHCFPPDSMPCAKGSKHGEKGCDMSVIMGDPKHLHGEVVFDQQQGCTCP